jgi:hypothetical protein
MFAPGFHHRFEGFQLIELYFCGLGDGDHAVEDVEEVVFMFFEEVEGAVGDEGVGLFGDQYFVHEADQVLAGPFFAVHVVEFIAAFYAAVCWVLFCFF